MSLWFELPEVPSFVNLFFTALLHLETSFQLGIHHWYSPSTVVILKSVEHCLVSITPATSPLRNSRYRHRIELRPIITRLRVVLGGLLESPVDLGPSP